jgi:fumarate hydratase, class II
MQVRVEKDTMGPIEVPADKYWGAQTQRSKENFTIGGQLMPKEVIEAFAILKKSAAFANAELGVLAQDKAEIIGKVCDEILEGKLDDQFPLVVWQTGSGTQSNMNVNEVVANRAHVLLGGDLMDEKKKIHPNDDVNKSQSSNDTFPTAMHIAAYKKVVEHTLPMVKKLHDTLKAKSEEFMDVVKIGRTHLMDATPLTLGQEFSGYAAQARKAADRGLRAIEALGELAIGGTAVGTGINTHPGFGARVAAILTERTGIPFREAANHFEAQAARDDCVEVAGQLATIAASLTKIANDIRWLGSGPRAGLAELKLPATQPGSSIMPGKVNPVMSEMLVQVGLYVQGLTQTVQLAGREGHFELNVTMPLIAHCLHESIHCLANGVRLFTEKCLAGLEADPARCRELVDRSLMLVTALNPHIGYDAAAAIAKEAYLSGRTLRELVLEKKLMDAAALDRALDPLAMTKPGASSPGAGGG